MMTPCHARCVTNRYTFNVNIKCTVLDIFKLRLIHGSLPSAIYGTTTCVTISMEEKGHYPRNRGASSMRSLSMYLL